MSARTATSEILDEDVRRLYWAAAGALGASVGYATFAAASGFL